MSNDRSSPFWRFSLALYARPGVAPACLRLQEEAGADVNVLLYATWLGTRGRKLDAGRMQSVVAAVEEWRKSAVVPLRSARRFLKNSPDLFPAPQTEALRTAVKKAELEAERLQQEALYRLRLHEDPANEKPDNAVAANIVGYESALGASFSREAVVTIEKAALQGACRGGDEQ